MPPIKNPSIVAKLAEFAENSKGVAYDDLPQHFTDSFKFRLRQAGVPLPTHDGGLVLTFDFMVGEDWSSLEVVDTVSHRLNSLPGPVSLAARSSLRDSLVYLVFGRVHPDIEARMRAAAVQPAPPAPGQMNGGDEHRVDMSGGDVDLGEVVETLHLVRVVERREPDGLPIFRDLYEVGPDEADSTREIIAAVLEEVRTFLESASAEQVDALAIKNPELVTFVKDLGTPADSAELRTLVTARKAALAAAPVPKRRVSALQRAN